MDSQKNYWTRVRHLERELSVRGSGDVLVAAVGNGRVVEVDAGED